MLVLRWIRNALMRLCGWTFQHWKVFGSIATMTGVTIFSYRMVLRHPSWQPYLRDLPDLAAYFLAFVGAIIPFLPELPTLIAKKAGARLTIAFTCFFVAWAAIVSNHLQRMSDDKERTATREQIGQLIAAAQIQATSDDVKRLDSHIGEGFANVTASIRGVKPVVRPPQVATGPQLPPALVQHLTFTQRRAPSSDPSLPYGLQVIIQTNINIQPVGFAFACTGEVGDVKFFIAGQSAYLSVATGISGEKKNIAFVKFAFPSLAPETPLVVTLLSKEDIRVTEVQQVH
jgi:hypothetical protein